MIGIETDVRTTKDGHVLVVHDKDFKRLSNVSSAVDKTELKDVPTDYKNDIANFFGCDHYTLKPQDQAKFVTLEKVFKELPQDQVLMIDIKDSKEKRSCVAVKELVEKYSR